MSSLVSNPLVDMEVNTKHQDELSPNRYSKIRKDCESLVRFNFLIYISVMHYLFQ